MYKDKLIRYVTAITDDGIIGVGNRLPWTIQEMKMDMKLFRQMTMYTPCICGRVTYEEMQKQSGKTRGRFYLKDRLLIAVSHRWKEQRVNDHVIVCDSLERALDIASSFRSRVISVIGGSKIYKELLEKCDEMCISHVHADLGKAKKRNAVRAKFILKELKKFMPLMKQYYPVSKMNKYPFTYRKYIRKKFT